VRQHKKKQSWCNILFTQIKKHCKHVDTTKIANILYLSIKNQSKTGKLLLTEGYSQTMRIIQRAPINANISSG
jgi:hypothetical protein